ncbi:HAMP domain-containing histidine kinase [Candidatus Woesebacteria bacterium]|nr:HAMP domain-containing histidine kinase [Candidatus Woesebacteria bacterium]
MTNLLTNANKYTNVGGKVEVFLRQKAGVVIIEISDNGIGIPLSEQKSIFNRFYRATNVTKTVTDGTGLGLYLAKAIINASGGDIGFSSQEGVGTTFWITIPLVGVRKKEGEVSLTLTTD